MGQAHPTARNNESKANLPTLRHEIEKPDTQALQKENAQLRELVVQLSKIVIKVVIKDG
ncbi:MAG: hypothetical protein WBF03_22730 [Xanthobacteraceae bacterium]|jgi:hypothetical protein